MFDDPKDKETPEETGLELEIDEEVEEEEPTDEPEAEVAEETPQEDEPEVEQDDPEDDLPGDTKVLKRMIRQQRLEYRQLQEAALRRTPPTEEEPDELTVALDALGKSSPEAAKVAGLLARKLGEIEATGARDRQNTAAMAKVSPKHREHVEAIATKYGLPVPVAHAIYKGALYDQAVSRKRAKATETPTVTAEPSRPQGAAPKTRPVRRTPETAAPGLVVIEGLKIKQKMKPGEYAALLDSLPPEKRKVVFRARRDGKVEVA